MATEDLAQLVDMARRVANVVVKEMIKPPLDRTYTFHGYLYNGNLPFWNNLPSENRDNMTGGDASSSHVHPLVRGGRIPFFFQLPREEVERREVKGDNNQNSF